MFIMQPRVVFIPGIMGSVLRDRTVPKNTCDQVLKDLRRVLTIANPLVALALKKAICSLDMEVLWGRADMLPWVLAPALWQPRLLQGDGEYNPDRVRPDGLLQLPGVDPYGPFIKCLGSRADVLVFPYDWRLSNDTSAKQLEFEILARWWGGRHPLEVPSEERVTIIGHSMGGLVARNFIEGRNGHRFVKQLITGGTPHRGAPKAYTDFHQLTLPFGEVLDTAVISKLLARVHPLLPGLIPRKILLGFLMPPKMQTELIRSYSSAIQLLPTFPFRVLTGGSLEPLSSTYASMQHAITRRPVTDVISLLRGGLQSDPKLDAWLGSVGVSYHLFGSTGLTTVQSFDVPTRSVISNNDGDGTVPLGSALLPAGTNIHVRAFARVKHQALFQDAGVQNECLALLGLPGTCKPTPELELDFYEAPLFENRTLPTPAEFAY